MSKDTRTTVGGLLAVAGLVTALTTSIIMFSKKPKEGDSKKVDILLGIGGAVAVIGIFIIPSEKFKKPII